MAIKTEQVSLDIQPCCDARGPVVCGRQGDEGTVLNVTVTQNGQAMPLDGLTAKLLGNNPNLLQLVGTVSGSTATFTLPSAFFSAACIVRLYVQLSQGEDVVASTQTFTLKVASGADLSASQAQGYVTQLDEALATAKQASQTAETAAEQATQAVDDANEALQTANTAVQNANTAADAANAAASNANSAAQAARGNVLRGTASGSVAHVEDAYAGAVAKEIRVMGKTRQNLWSNPPTNTQNGMALTSNADGSLTLDGTASEASCFYVDVYCLKPGASYTLSLDRSVNASISVQSYGDSGYIADSVFVGKGSTSAVGTVSQNATKFRLMVQMNAGITNDNVTVRVMLNEGSEAQPWCPPGLNSIEELEILTAGKNLLKDTEFNNVFLWADNVKEPNNSILNSLRGIPLTLTWEGEIISADDPSKLPSSQCGVWIELMSGNTLKTTQGHQVQRELWGAGAVVGAKKKIVYTITIPEDDPVKNMYIYGCGNSADGSYRTNGITNVRIQLELGSASTDYEPPAVTTTPVDLDGHELRSLPDGTCDVLTWNADGTLSIEQVTQSASTSGGFGQVLQSWASSNPKAFSVELLGVENFGSMTLVKNRFMCDSVVYGGLDADAIANAKQNAGIDFNTVYCAAAYSQNKIIVNIPSASSVEEATSWLQNNPLEIVLPLAENQTVPLAPATMPALPGSTANVWAACDPPTEVDLTYERDLTIAYDNLAEQIATTAAALAVAQATD